MAGRNTFFKANYTQEERDECFKWFEDRMDRLPKSIDNIPAFRFTDLPYTVKRIMTILKANSGTTLTFNGEFSLLLLIRQKLIECGAIADEGPAAESVKTENP